MPLVPRVAHGLPGRYRSESFDASLSIAVLHHISTLRRRVALVREAMRVVRVGGQALFYAWACGLRCPMLWRQLLLSLPEKPAVLLVRALCLAARMAEETLAAAILRTAA